MKTLKGIFSDVTYTKIEYVKDDIADEKYHVYKRNGLFDTWFRIDTRKTLVEAEELARSRGDKVVYMGIYENGVKKGVTDWEEPKEAKQVPAPLPNVLPPDENVEFERKYLRKVPKK